MNWESLGVSIAVALKAMTLAAPALLYAALAAVCVVAAWRLVTRRRDGSAGTTPAAAVLLARAPHLAPVDTLAQVRPLVGPAAPRAPRAPPELSPIPLTPAHRRRPVAPTREPSPSLIPRRAR